MMNRYVAIAALLLIIPQLSQAEEQRPSNDSLVVKSEQQSVFKGLLYSVWGKLRALNPAVQRGNRNTRVVVTAGVRGAETTDSIISPYWMGDRTDDPDYLRELEEYTRAQQLAEKGDLEASVRALSAFIEAHEASDFRASAQFALGISYGGLGQKQQSVETLQAFTREYPGHPLVADAELVIKELK